MRLPLLLLLLLAAGASATPSCISQPGVSAGQLVFPVDQATATQLECFHDSRRCSKTKFSICMTLDPAKIEENSCRTVFTTGGETPYAFGSYLLYLGHRQFLLGVSGQDSSSAEVRWDIEFEITKSDLPVYVCGTWEDRSGLNLFVDGMRAIIRQSGIKKHVDKYFLEAFVPFQETMMFCKGNTGLKPEDSGISDICIEEAVWDAEQIRAKKLPYTDLKCTKDTTVPSEFIADEQTLTSSPETYQMDCYENCGYFRPNPKSTVDIKQVYAIHKVSPTHGQCLCIKKLQFLDNITRVDCSEAANLAYHLHLTSQLYLPPVILPHFNATVYSPYGQQMYTGDSILFELKIHRYSPGGRPVPMQTANYVVRVDFGDGTSAELKQNVFSHAYATAGEKTIVMKLESKFGGVTQTQKILLKNKETEETVDIDVAKIFGAQDGERQRIAYTAAVAGRLEKTAKIYLDGALKQTVTVPEYSKLHPGLIDVAGIGRFNLSMCVSNGRTQKCTDTSVLVGDPVNRVIHALLGQAVEIEFPNLEAVKDKLELRVFPDDKKLEFEVKGNKMVLSSRALAALGFLQMQLRAIYDAQHPILSRRLLLQACPSKVSVEPEKRSGLKNDVFPVDFRIAGFGSYDVTLCDGLHECEFMQLDGISGERLLQRRFEYNVMGIFPVTLRVGNQLCSQEQKVIIGTQVPISDAEVVVNPPSSIGSDLVLHLFINKGSNLPIGGESNKAKVQLGSLPERTYDLVGNLSFFGPFVLRYPVSRYGDFSLVVRLENDIGSKTVVKQVRIGEQITGVSSQLLQPVAGRSRNAEFLLNLNTGNPVTVKFESAGFWHTIGPLSPHDHKDNTRLYLWRRKQGANYTMLPAGPVTFTLSEVQAPSEPYFESTGSVQLLNGGRSLKFSMLGCNFQHGSNEISIQVLNAFGSVPAQKLCGNIFHSTSTETCRIESAFTTEDGQQLFVNKNKYKIEKSKKLQVTAASTGSGACEAVPWHYHWQLLKVVDDSKSPEDLSNLQTMPKFCTSDASPQFALPEHSLPYGTYRLCVFAAPNTFPLNTQERLCQTVEVERSNLFCEFSGEKDRGVNFGETLDIDFSACRDPDDFSGSNPVSFVGSCVSESHKDQYKDVNCCELPTGSDANWKQLNFTGNGSSEAATFKFFDYGGSCFPKPSLLAYKDADRTILAEPDALNNNDMMKMCICASDSMDRRAIGRMQVKVLVIRNIQDAQNTLNDLDVSNPGRALAVISIISGTLKDSNDTDLVAEVKEAASSKVDEVSKNLQDANQAVTLGETLASITDGGDITPNTKKSSSSALSNTANTLKKFKTANLNQVTGATRGSALTAGNIQSTLTPRQKSQLQCLRNMRSLGVENTEACGTESPEAARTARRRRSVMQNPLDPSQHSDGDEKMKSSVCSDIPEFDTLDPRAFFYLKTCEAIKEKLLYVMPDMLSEEFDERDRLRFEEEEMDRKREAEVANKAMGALRSCAGTALTKGDKAEVKAKTIAVMSKRAPEKLGSDEDAVSSDSDDGGVSMPPGLLPKGSGMAMQTFRNNPINHGDRAMNSPTISATRNDASGEVVDTKDVEQPINIFIKRKATQSNCVIYPTKHDDKIGNCHCVNLTKANHVISVFVRDLKNDTAMSDVKFNVYLNNGSCPDAASENYTWVGRLPRTADEIRANLSLSELRRLDGSQGLQLQNELQNTLMLPPNLTSTAGWYCVFVTLATATVQFDPSSQAVQPNIFYEYCSHVDNPAYFDEKNETWKSDGVSVGPLSCRSLMQLKVTHLTSFASDFVVPPNTIDFNTVWAKFKNLSENAAVFSTVISILILYIILMVWGRIMDKKDIKRWGATHLKDNLPTDTYMYQVSVMTGYRKGSGTKSKVYFIVSGDGGDSGIRELSDGERKGFDRGAVLNFVLSAESSLGQLTFLRIWHDNSGKGQDKSWYLDQVVVNDLQTGDKFFFLCNNWLAVEEGDGMVERILPVSGFADLVAFKQLFSSSVQRKLRNEHLWFSIFSRPTRSAFTRVQRLSCCLSLLFLTMITNAMFFRSEENVEKRTGVTVGPITFTMDQLFVSIVSTLIVFPPSIIIITFFKKCRAKTVTNKVMQKNQDLSTKSNKYTWRSINKDSQLFNIAEDGETSGWGGEASMQKKNNRLWDSLKNIVSFHSSKKETAVEDPELKKNKPFLFPHWCIYIAWVLVFLSVFGSAFFVILYSMEWGRDKANDWLVTFVLSFVQNVVLVQPIKVLLLAAVISMIIRKPENDDEEAAFDEAMGGYDEELVQRKEVDIQQIMLQRRTAREDLCMPNQEKLAEIREIRLKEIKMGAIIKEMVAYAIFVLVVFFISYQTRSLNSFKLGDVVRSTFTKPFDNSVPTYKDFYKYLNTVLVPRMYAGDFENGQRATWRDKLAINDGSRNIIRVGVPRLRQFRVKDDTCQQPNAFDRVIRKPCRSAYGWVADDTKPYEPFWRPMADDKWRVQKKNKSFVSPFVYSSSLKLKGLPYMAKVNTYKGGGYVLNFARTKELVQRQLQDIFELNWLDTRTRAVFIEFTVYNAPSNLFASVIMVAEFLETGGSVTYSEVKVFRLFSYVGSFGAVVLLMEIVFALFVLYFSVREGLQIKEQKCKYFSGFWNILEFVTLSITCTAVVMYIFKKILASVAMDALKSAKSSDFVNFGSIATYDELYAYMVGIVVFISTIKFIKILRFNKRMGMLGATLKMAARDLKSFMVMFAVYFMAFCHSAYLIFGRHLMSYGSFSGTWQALFSMALGSFNFHELHQVNPLLGPAFFFSFVSLVSFALLGIFLTIINDSFSVVKANADLQGNEYELVEFMTKRVKQLFGCSMMGGGDAEEEDADADEQKDEDSEEAGGNSASFSGSLSKLKF